MAETFSASTNNIGSAAYTVLHELLLTEAATISFELVNETTSSSALTSFVIERQVHEDGGWASWLADSDFDQITNSDMLFASTTPAKLAVGATSHCTIRTGVAYAIRFTAKSVGTSNLSLRGRLE